MSRGWLRRKPKPTGEQAWFLPTLTNKDAGLLITAARGLAPATRVQGFLVVDDPDRPDAVTFITDGDGTVHIIRAGSTERLADVVTAGVTLRRTTV